MAGILGWLRDVGKPWLGTWRWGRGREELAHERVRARMLGIAQRMRFLPYLDSGTGETAVMRRVYPQMLKEPSIKAALLDKVLSVAALDLSVNPGDEGPRHKQAADFGLHLLNRVASGDYGITGLSAIVEQVILPGLIHGWSIAEKIWGLEHRGKWAGKAILKWLKNKEPERELDLEIDDCNNITAVLGRGPNAGQRWDKSGFVIWRHLSIFDNPAGMSDLRASYRAYWAIQTSWQFRMVYLEKFSSPMLKGTYTAEGTQKADLEQALEDAKSATWISIPQGALVDALELGIKGTADFQSAINDLKHEVFLGISGAILQALEGTTTEGRGSSAVHKSTADIRKWHIRANVESVINSQILPDATDLNFAAAAVPQASLGGVDDSEMATSLAVDVGLNRDLRLSLSRKDLYKRYGRPEPLDQNDALVPASAPAATPGGAPHPFAEPVAAVREKPDLVGLATAFLTAKKKQEFADIERYCGGEGGTPGPCPEGGGDAVAPTAKPGAKEGVEPKKKGKTDAGKTNNKGVASAPKPPALEAAKAKFVGKTVGAAEHAAADAVSVGLAKSLGGKTEEETADAGQKDKKPYDVQVQRADGKGTHDIEVKSLLKGEKQGISVHEDALLRKVNHAADHPDNVFHTVVRDERATYSGGEFAGSYSGHDLYYKRGSGRYTLNQMHKVKDEAELKALLETPDDKLPPAAQGSLPPPPPIAHLQATAAAAGESRKARDKARKERNKDVLRAQAQARAAKAKAAKT